MTQVLYYCTGQGLENVFERWNQVSGRPSMAASTRSTFSLFFQIHLPLMRKTTQACSLPFLPFFFLVPPPLSFFGLWATTINSSRNHVTTGGRASTPSYLVVVIFLSLFFYRFLLFLYHRLSVDAYIRTSPTPSLPPQVRYEQ
jgi:hypothetical protein